MADESSHGRGCCICVKAHRGREWSSRLEGALRARVPLPRDAALAVGVRRPRRAGAGRAAIHGWQGVRRPYRGQRTIWMLPRVLPREAASRSRTRQVAQLTSSGEATMASLIRSRARRHASRRSRLPKRSRTSRRYRPLNRARLGYGRNAMPATGMSGLGRSGERELLDRLLANACAGHGAPMEGGRRKTARLRYDPAHRRARRLQHEPRQRHRGHERPHRRDHLRSDECEQRAPDEHLPGRCRETPPG